MVCSRWRFLRCDRKDSELYVPIGLLALNTISCFVLSNNFSVSQSVLLTADSAVIAVKTWSAKQEPFRHHCSVRSGYTCLNAHGICSSCDSNQASSSARASPHAINAQLSYRWFVVLLFPFPIVRLAYFQLVSSDPSQIRKLSRDPYHSRSLPSIILSRRNLE